MAAALASEPGDAEDLPLPGALQPGYYLVPDAGPPPEYADAPVRELVSAVPSHPGSGFQLGGALDTCTPSGALAGLADAAIGDGRLAALSDDELVGVLRACQRVESWASANLLATIAELTRRRPAEGTPAAPPGEFPEQISEFVSDEVAAALTLTGRAASDRTDLSLELATRLPGTFRAHYAGLIDYPRVRLIAEATRILSDEQARQVEAHVLSKATKQTTGQLRATLARAVLAADPQAAARRREEAQKDPRVRRWQEDVGTAALAGYGLPPADVLAADQQLTAPGPHRPHRAADHRAGRSR